VVNVSYVHFHHRRKNEKTTKATIATTKMVKGMPTWTSNQRMDFQSENEQMGDPNKNYAIKGVQKLDFHPPKAD
jgi:hypothetical protein